ncbi:enoyl-CoA hydratase-related protein [Extensimonas vulgaris]|uniref:Methylglutaconyl-CoA hydratase n=1 Tax=Extensimonas vulgaris TaxID=1031594 RepID=A0A369ALA2_9BURK|nr:enoyl-CoA hydratase-related protein [Extensimonas vulgaris]RCX10130.1 methylglutaconyl-CoA hydratase [Extensimonas vulgaris]TWI39711.1 methylglutaconyl-CoA hydratase [Extensimonas vulgaris]TXD17279.1 enoyl-CoA hydratase [Extensimonas vulgaris]
MASPTFETIHLDIDALGVARLTLARPDMHNALNPTMFEEIDQALDTIEADPTARVVVLSGAGESFCAGGDFRWQQSQREQNRASRIRSGMPLAHVLARLDTFGRPIIGRINGSAYGGGVGLISICDVVVAVDSAKISLSEVRLGLVPATISPYVAAKLGPSYARRVFLNGKIMSAAEAQRYGLVHEVVPAAELDQAVNAEIDLALACAPGAVQMTKKLVQYVLAHDMADNLIYTVDRLADFWETDEAREGLTSFYEKRAPAWRRKHSDKA